jgi:hypothetical protein
MKQLKKVLRSALDAAGYTGFNTRSPRGYARDGLFTTHRDHFRRDPAFRAAYARGVPARESPPRHGLARSHCFVGGLNCIARSGRFCVTVQLVEDTLSSDDTGSALRCDRMAVTR